MTKARTLADFISDGSPLADGTVDVSEVSGAAPLASPTFTGGIDVTGTIDSTDYLTAKGLRIGLDNNNDIYAGNSPIRSTANAFYFKQTSTGEEFIRFQHPDVVVNEFGYDHDFRVESDSNTHALFVDAGNSSVSINSSNQMATGLHVTGPTSSEYRTFFVSNEADVTKGVCIAYDPTNDRGVISAVDAGTGWKPLYIENTSLTIDNGLVVNEGGNDHDFRVESDSNANMLFVDAGQNNVGIGKAPQSGQGTLQTVGSTAATNYYRPAGQYHIFGESSGNGNDEWVYLGGSYTDTDKSVGYVMQDYNGNFGQYAGSYIRSNQAKVRIGHFVGGANSGAAPSLADNFIFDTAGGAVFNERGEYGDFRVESDSNTHALFVDGSHDIVGIGTAPSIYLNNNSFLNAKAHIANSAYIGNAYYSTIANPNGIQLRLDTGSNGQQAFIRLEGSQYNGYRCTYFWAVNYSGNWTVTSNTNHTSGTAPTFTVDNNSSPQPQINLGFSTGYSGGYCIVNASSHWHII